MVIDDTGSVEDIHAFIYCKKWRFGQVSPMPDRQTDSQSKDSATQLLTKYKSGALVTQYVQNKAKLLLLTRQPTHNIKYQKGAVQKSEQSISLIFCFRGYKRFRDLFHINKRTISHFYWKVGQETFTQDFSVCKASVRKLSIKYFP